MTDPSRGLLTELLRQVSRSFYLTLRVLPAAIRWQIGLAYLLARATDTIADTQIIAPADRLRALQALRARILGKSSARLELGELSRRQDSPAEWSLLQRVEESLALLEHLPADDRERIRDALEVIITGQESDLIRFADASRERIVALNTDDELDEYTYRVAGCVGEFWTKICRAHLSREAGLRLAPVDWSQDPGKTSRFQSPRPGTPYQNQPVRGAPDSGPHAFLLPLAVRVETAVRSGPSRK